MGHAIRNPRSGSLRTPEESGPKIAALGGTFDMLHEGHKRLITRAFEIADIVFIGVTGDSLVSGLRKGHRVRPYAYRSRKLRSFLKSEGWLSRARIVELKDPFGLAARRRRLDALVVSQETYRAGLRLNSLRRRRGLRPVRLYVVRLVKAQDGLPITSTRIRQGEIDSEGTLTPKLGCRLRIGSPRSLA